MSRTFRIFGYASLINEDSLKKTVPDATNIRPCKIYGFVRVFNVESTTRFCKEKGVPACVMNLEKDEINNYVNGITFEMSEKHFNDLLNREGAYELVEVDCYDYESDSKYRANFFRSPKYEAYPYQSGQKEQEEYLKTCLDGCKKYGEQFLDHFKETTYIGNKTLKELRY